MTNENVTSMAGDGRYVDEMQCWQHSLTSDTQWQLNHMRYNAMRAWKERDGVRKSTLFGIKLQPVYLYSGVAACMAIVSLSLMFLVTEPSAGWQSSGSAPLVAAATAECKTCVFDSCTL